MDRYFQNAVIIKNLETFIIKELFCRPESFSVMEMMSQHIKCKIDRIFSAWLFKMDHPKTSISTHGPVLLHPCPVLCFSEDNCLIHFDTKMYFFFGFFKVGQYKISHTWLVGM